MFYVDHYKFILLYFLTSFKNANAHFSPSFFHVFASICNSRECYWWWHCCLWLIKCSNDCRCCFFVINRVVIGRINEVTDEIWEQTWGETVVSREKTNLNLSINKNLTNSMAPSLRQSSWWHCVIRLLSVYSANRNRWQHSHGRKESLLIPLSLIR